jgi:SAM-dependent methyltransferase
MNAVRSVVRSLLPTPLRRWLVRQTRWPRIGNVRPEDLRRTEPISRAWGGDRGKPVDRHYIEQFLARHTADIRGCVLEFGDHAYARRFGSSGVERFDVADVDASNVNATLIVDLATGAGMPDRTFDCIICTQTLQFVPDPGGAAAALHGSLKPGGVLLLTVPAISQVVVAERNPWKDYWRYTGEGLQQLLSGAFPPESMHIETFGNVFTAVAFLHGLAAEELTAEELEHRDRAYPLIVAGRAVAP